MDFKYNTCSVNNLYILNSLKCIFQHAGQTKTLSLSLSLSLSLLRKTELTRVIEPIIIFSMKQNVEKFICS